MIWRKKYLLFLIMFGLAFFSGLVLVKFGNFNFVNAQETLSCTVRTSSCEAGEVVIFRMQKTTNSHAGTPTGSSYTNLVCCGGVTGLGNDCNAANKKVVLKLSGATNAHVRQNSYGDYAGGSNVCLSAPSGNTISVAYRSGSCEVDEATLASISGPTNAHVASTAYTTKICAKITGLSTAIEIKDQNSINNVGTITFPAGTISTEVSNPSNDQSETQVFGASSLPVVTLVTATAYIAHITITSGTGWTDTVTNENYYIDTAHARNITTATFNANKTSYSSWGTDVDTGVTLATANANDLYLSVNLTALAGKSGTSTLTILGEAL
jgi:hypothetical protein